MRVCVCFLSAEVMLLQQFGCYMAGATRNCCRVGAFCVRETAAVSARSVCIIQPCSMECTSYKPHTLVAAARAFSCNLPPALLAQNARDLLRATAVTQGWNRYRNKSQHRKLTVENKTLPPLLLRFEPTTFRSRIRRSFSIRFYH